MPRHAKPAEADLVEMLRQRAETYGDKVAFTFSYDGDGVNGTQLTYRELDTRARTIAAWLQEQGAAGERVLVLCRPGLDHIAGYFGCVYAGAVAVPVHERLAPRLSSVVPDARARFALGITETHEVIKAALAELGEGSELQWGLMDEVVADRAAWSPPETDPHAPAMVQYTSGSTTAPKGVVLTHENLLRNIESIRQSWPADDSAIGCFWLPSHHDMGLIGGVLAMIYIGATTHLMSPTAFIKQPMRWLEAVSRHRASYTVAPNFAYDLCVQHSTAEQRAALDLSCLITAMNGAEPVQAATLDAFAEAFAPAGFRPEAFSAAYGLAEATVMVSVGTESIRPRVRHADLAALGDGRVVESSTEAPSIALVSCGRPRGSRVVIVDPVTRRRCADDEVGEIWCAGPSVGQGYWGRPAETAEIFRAEIAETSESPYLRTGDLGFLEAGELFVTGRCKDLIDIRGCNFYPSDIERTVQGLHPALLTGRGAAFAFTPGLHQVERLVIVQEVDRAGIDHAGIDDVFDGIRTAIEQRYGVAVHSVLLVERVSIPTTSSGKIQRSECRRRFLHGELAPVATWQEPSAADDLASAREYEIAVAAADFVRSVVAGGSAAVEMSTP